MLPSVNFWIEENIDKGTLIGRLSSSTTTLSSSSPTVSSSSVDLKYASAFTCAYISLAQQPISNYFHIDSNDGSVYALRKIDREALCTEHQVLERFRKNVNNMTIMLKDSSYKDNIAGDNLGVIKQTVSTEDQITNENLVDLSTTTDGTRHSRNVLQETDISQTVTTSVCQIKFQVLISDTTGLMPKSNVLQDVQITISDLNDNQPQFGVQNFSLKIPESSPIDAEFRLPQANDLDTGVNGISEYRMVRCIHKDGDKTFPLYPYTYSKDSINQVQKHSETNIFNDHNDKLSSNEEMTGSFSKNYAGEYFMLKIYSQSNGRLQPILKQIRLLDREQVEWLYFCLVAVDGGGLQGHTCGYIEIIDANDNVPQWIDLPYRVSISECDQDKQYTNIHNTNYNMYKSQFPPLRLLYTLKAKDSDSGAYGQITYRLAQDSMTGHTNTQLHQPKILIREDKLYLLSKLDYEQLTRFVVYVEAVDGGGLVNFTEVEVTVEDCNDHAPTIMLIPVRSSPNTNNQTYSSSKNSHHNMLSVSSLPKLNMDLLWMEEENYDQIKLATVMSFDRDKKDNGRVTCYLDKSGQLINNFDYSQLFELVPNRPILDPTSTTVNENFSSMKQNDVYGNITLTDKPSIFSLYKKGGVKVDREENQKLLFDIVCTDNGEVNLQLTRRTLHVIVGDVNDHPPQILTTNNQLDHALSYKERKDGESFISQVFTVPENEPLGTYVGTVLAKDIDEGINSQLLYSFISATNNNPTLRSNSNELFEIDNLTGRITTRIPLDREAQSSYIFSVQVMDSGKPSLSSSCKVQINVADVNDMPPIFETSDPSGRIVFQVTESVGNRRVHGRLVGRLKAYDSDFGSNQTIRYAFVNDSLSPAQLPVLYRISLDGHIYADGNMDREAYKEHQFTVIAVDGGPANYQLTSSAVVLVKLLDINDNPPHFIYPSSNVLNKIPSDLMNVTVDTSPGTVLYSVQVTDLDEPQNTKLSFALHSARFLSDYFTLKQNDVHISETKGYTEASADLILVNSLTQLLPTYKMTHTTINEANLNNLNSEPSILSSTKVNGGQHYPAEYFLYIIVKDSDKETGFTSTARLRIHVYSERLSPSASLSSSIIASRQRSNLSTISSALQIENSGVPIPTIDGTSNAEIIHSYGVELRDMAQMYQSKSNTHNSNNMTILLIISIVIICVFIGVFCSVAIFYIRGNVVNCREVNGTRSSEVYTTAQPTCTDNWSVGEISEHCKTPSSWEALNCKDMAVHLSNVEQNTLNNKSKTYIITQPPNYPNTEHTDTTPMTFSPMFSRNHKVNFITTSQLNSDSEQIAIETTCAPFEQHYDYHNNNESIHHIYSRLPTNITTSSSVINKEPHGTYLAPYYQELYYPALKPTFKTILRSQGQVVSTSTSNDQLLNIKTDQINLNLLQNPVINENTKLFTFIPPNSPSKLNTDRVIGVNFHHSSPVIDIENIHGIQTTNPSQNLNENAANKSRSSMNDLSSCIAEKSKLPADHQHLSVKSNNLLVLSTINSVNAEKQTGGLLWSRNEQPTCVECNNFRTSTNSTL
ncbi:unnamed protein product [Heterobilharzia americana]|nr:unnamed protein product [Heterobilharzia americana]